MTDPRNIQRYNAQLTFNGTNWIGVEQFNTLGTVTIPVQPTAELESAGLFIANKTTVKATLVKAVGVMTIQLTVFTANSIEIFLGSIAASALANGDKLLVEVEVINVTE